MSDNEAYFYRVMFTLADEHLDISSYNETHPFMAFNSTTEDGRAKELERIVKKNKKAIGFMKDGEKKEKRKKK